MMGRRGGEAFFSGITELRVEIDAHGLAGGGIRQEGEPNAIGTMHRRKNDRG
jgi:hypothetical protein